MISNSPIRILIVDDHAVVRNGLTAIIGAYEHFMVSGEATNGQEAVIACDLLPPDLILMDLMMPVMDGLAATQLISKRHPLVPILILTSYIDEQLISDVIAAGAIGYILKNGDIEELTKAILSVHRGDPYLSPQASQLLMQRLTTRDQPTLGDNLTARETSVLKLITKGHTNRQIALDLSIAPATVKFHVGNILSKLHASSRTEAGVKALQYDLVPAYETPDFM